MAARRAHRAEALTSEARPNRSYEKPAVIGVSLVAEEVLATGCKVLGVGAGPIIPACAATPCFNIGTS